MHFTLIAAALVTALAAAGPAGAAGSAAADVPQPWAETSAPAASTPKPRAAGRQAAVPARADVVPLASGEAAGSVARPRRLAKNRQQVRREARASHGQRRSADGWEQLGGEAGTRSRP